MSSTYDVMCLCNGDLKCPHALHKCIPPQFEEIEKTVDGVLEQFDRKSIKKYIKGGDSLKNQGKKSQSTGSMVVEKGATGQPDQDMVFVVEANNRPSSSDQLMQYSNNKTSNNNNNNNNNSYNARDRPNTTISGSKHLAHSSSAPVSLFSKSLDMASSQGVFPQIASAKQQQQQQVGQYVDSDGYNSGDNQGYGSLDEDDNLSIGGGNSVVAGLSSERHIDFNFANGVFEGGNRNKSNRSGSPPRGESSSSSFVDGNNNTVHVVTSTMGDSLLKVGLNRMADNLVRKSLPWQAVCCPRAVEQMRDIRFSLSLQKHSQFTQKMIAQLEGRVSEFLAKKAEEVDSWVRNETHSWEQGCQSEERTITGFINDDMKRIHDKNMSLENARLSREIKEDNSVDDGERDMAREQLIKFRRLVQSDSHQNTDVRVLHASIETAKTKATANLDMNSRELMKRLEEAHEWLCCLSDNAITAAESEVMLKDVFTGLDNERSRGLVALTGAIEAYTEQQAIILEAMSSFVGRIRRYNADFLSREQLVSRAFIQYLLNVLQNEVKVNTSQTRKSEIAWQTKHVVDRTHAKDQQLLVDFNLTVQKFEKVVLDLKDKLRIQADEVKHKLQSVLNGRDNDVTRRKAVIHKRLGAHVNTMCQKRRLKLKLFKEQKKDELDIENRCIVLCSSFLQDLRSSIDSTWVRENLKERRMNEASRGRMERLEKSALIIWNKHSHLAIESKEECVDWMQIYLQERQSASDERKSEIERDYKNYRKRFGHFMKNFVSEIRPAVKLFMKQSCSYNINDPVDKNFTDLMEASQKLGSKFTKIQMDIRDSLAKYLEEENIKAKDVASRRRNHLLLSWRGHLDALNDVLNKRIFNLKDMEKELEETVRLTIAQNEVESSIFEQSSCARLEQFWLDYRSRFSTLSREIQENYEDYLVVKEQKMNNKGVTSKKTVEHLEDEIRNKEEQPPKKSAPKITDTQRIKIILDEVRNEHYGSFLMKVTRGLEQLKAEIGEGPKRYLPAYMVLKVLFAACDLFWDASNLSEKVIGKMYRRGHVVQFDASLGELPTNGRALFCVGASFSILSNIVLNYGLIDCSDILQSLQKGLKRVFLPGMLLITQQFGGYGDALIKAECLWACSTCKTKPPIDLVDNFRDVFHNYESASYTASSAEEKQEQKMNFQANSYLKDLKMAGFYSSDPVDLVNSVLTIPVPANVHESMSEKIDITSSMGTRNPYKKPTKKDKEPIVNPEIERHAQMHAQYQKEQEERQRQKKKLLINDLEEEVDLNTMLNRMASTMPVADITVLVAALGRPDSKFEVTPHIFVQAVSLWRKAAVAISFCTLDPPGIDYIRATDLLSEHVAVIQGKRKGGVSNLVCMSPFGAVSNYIDWLTSVRGMPISVIQALCMLTKGGSVDPWLEDPKLSHRGARFIYEITEFIEVLFTCRYFKSTDLKGMRAVVPSKIEEIIKNFDVNGSCQVPLELLRNFIQKDTGDIINNQITAAYYSVCRNKIQEMFEVKQRKELESAEALADQADDLTVDSDIADDHESYLGRPLKTVREVVATEFSGDISGYMARFSEDVRKFLESMPSLDTSVVIGVLHGPLEPSAAHELVSDAVKLDASARNSMPTSCAIWMGSGLLESEDAIKVISVPGDKDVTGSNEANIVLGAGSTFQKFKEDVNLRRLKELKTLIELDFLAKYPILSEQKSSDEFYSASGGKAFSQEDHWKELLSRRLGRIDKLTLAWRDTMLNEWASSMYSSRRERYDARAAVIKACVKVYHKQYVNLRISMIQSRENISQTYPALDDDLMAMWKKDREFITFHSSFLDRLLRLMSSNIDRAVQIARDCMSAFQKHCGAIKRRAVARYKRAHEILEEDMNRSCQSLITGYTGGFAQKFFDDLMQRGDTLRQSITDLHGVIILEKEKFVYFKDELERELTFTIADKISIDRARTKSLLDSLAMDTAAIQESLADLRAKYASIQKDSNARLIIRIEKSIRDVRKLRTAAEQNPEIEKQAFSEIRAILSKAKRTCLEIVKQITEESENILANIDPMRGPHRSKMEKKVAQFISGWSEVEKSLLPLIESFQLECGREIKELVTKCRSNIEAFRDSEIRKLSVEFLKARKSLIVAFRHHFSNYDMSESAIFEKYNYEIRSTVQEVRTCWGPTLPSFIKVAITDIANLAHEACRLGAADIKENTLTSPLHGIVDDDDWIHQRFEIMDISAYSIYQFQSSILSMPERFIKEKNDIILTSNSKLMTKNGDMIRPQVVAVMELLISGIEIESDFRHGYDSLAQSTNAKSNETLTEVKEFYKRFTSNESTVSIPNSATQVLSRIERRRDEVISMIDASNAHLIADHSRLEVLIAGADKDIEEWNNLTTELVESAFKNAEDTFLKSLFPTPPPSPRNILGPEDDAEDEDRIGKIKAMLGLLSVEDDMDKQADDAKKKKVKRKVKKNFDEAPPKPSKLDKIRELQQGWLELDTVEGYLYYYNPTTGESLWELPESLKKPLKESEDEDKFLDTPRELLLEDERYPDFAPLHAIEYRTPLASNPEIVMADIAEICRSVTDFSVDTAFEVTSVIRGAIRHFVRSPKPKSIRDKEEASKMQNVTGLGLIPKTVQFDRLLENHSKNDRMDDLGDIDNFDDKYALEDEQDEDDFDSYAQFDAAKEAGLLMLDDEYVLNLSRDDQKSMSNEWLIAGLGGDFLADSIDAHNKAEKQKIILENRYKESRETDNMIIEDGKSRLLAEQRHNGYIEIFHHKLTELLSEPGLKQSELDHLVSLTTWIRKSAVAEVFAVHQVSWDRLQQIVKETIHAEAEAKLLAERMRTEAGRERIRMMKEHQDDIDEMTNFFYSEAGLSKTNARRLSGEAIIRNVTTAKKMAKLWQRGDLDLMTLGLDHDDKEDIENSLRTLLMKPNPKNNVVEYSEMLQITNGGGGSCELQEQRVVLRDIPPTHPGKPSVPHIITTRPPETSSNSNNNNRPNSRGRALTPKDSFGLDPSLVTEVVEEYDIPDDESQIGGDSMYYSPSHSRSNRDLGGGNSGYNSKPRTPDPNATYQKDWSGYRSFKGGWIEGLSSDNNVYYYNTVTGESAWELPPGAHPIDATNSNKAMMHQPTQNYNSFIGHKHDQDPSWQLVTLPANMQQTAAAAPNKKLQKKLSKYGDRIPPRVYVERELPLPVTPEVAAFSRYEGMARQLPLLKVQDQFQNYLVKSQFQISEAKAGYLKYKEDIFDKASKNVESKLLKFLNDMKSLQKFCTKFTEDTLKEERELRRMLDEPNYYSPELVKALNINIAKVNDILLAEKLSIILEALDRMKMNSKLTTENTWSQIDKFGADWELLKAELLQSGDLYDEQQTNALESCRMTSEYAAKLFVYDISSSVNTSKMIEMENIRNNFHHAFLQDPKEEAARKRLRSEQINYQIQRDATKAQLEIEFANGWSHLVEQELAKLGYPPLVKEHLVKPEEEYVMSFLLRQVEMEVSLRDDYESIQEATESLSREMFEGIVLLDEQEKVTVAAGGSWFTKHRDTISRHSAALEKTLKIMKQKVADGYKKLCDNIQILDYDIERQAESTIAQLDAKKKK